jgi:predicted DCC family thiol-disulfide oxidoreductase YuxK
MQQTKPILLFNDECDVCRHIAHWVERSAPNKSGETSIIERPIGDDPEALRALNPELDIWKAYATVHVLMPDGSMKVGGEAVAEVLRNLPNTRWFAGVFDASIFGVRPFQAILNAAYAVLADVRPLLGCESCGTPGIWLRPLHWAIKRAKDMLGQNRYLRLSPHFTPLRSPNKDPRFKVPH